MSHTAVNLPVSSAITDAGTKTAKDRTARPVNSMAIPAAIECGSAAPTRLFDPTNTKGICADGARNVHVALAMASYMGTDIIAVPAVGTRTYQRVW